MADEKGKTSSISFRIENELKERLIQEAKKDRRVLSQYIQVIVLNHLDSLEAKANNQDKS